MLVELVRHVGKTVTRDQLLDRVWAGRFTTPDVLTQAIKELRRAFADDSRPPQYIETIPKVGYRLIAPVLVLDGPDGGVFIEVAAKDAVNEGSDAGASGPATTEVASPSATRWNAARTAWAAAIALAVLGVALLALWRSGARVGESAQPVAHSAWKAVNQRSVTSYPGPEYRPSISPDGSRIAFSMRDPASTFDRILIRSIDDSQLVHLTLGTNRHEAMPEWSPDGTRIVFERIVQNACAMFVASSLGGGEREVGPCNNDYIVNYYDWSPDGKSLITAQSRDGATGVQSLMRWSLDTGERQFLDYPRRADDAGCRTALFAGRSFHRVPPRACALQRSVRDGRRRRCATTGDARCGSHSRVRVDARRQDARLRVEFPGLMSLFAVDTGNGTLQPLGISPAEYPEAARNADSIVYEIPRTHDLVAYVPIRSGAAPDPKPLAPSTGSDYNGTVSPSGDRIVFVSDRSGQVQLWLYDRATEAATALTRDANIAVFAPRWSPDGTHIVAVAHGVEGRRLIEIEVATQRQRVLSKPGENVLFGAYGIDPDTYLIAAGPSARDDSLILVAHPASADEARRVMATGVAYADVDTPAHRIYYTSVERGLFRRGFDDGPAEFVTSKVNALTLNGWRVVDGRVWYITGIGDKPEALREVDPATGDEREIARLNVTLRDVNFSVMPERDGVIVSVVGAEDTDVGAFDLTRASGP